LPGPLDEAERVLSYQRPRVPAMIPSRGHVRPSYPRRGHPGAGHWPTL